MNILVQNMKNSYLNFIRLFCFFFNLLNLILFINISLLKPHRQSVNINLRLRDKN